MISVVIAEDDPMVAHINRQYISLFPDMAVPIVFSNVQDAWEYISCKAPDLLILDVYMPLLSGMEVLRKMRGNNIVTEVIMVTAANEIADVDTALKLGIVDYLIKPFEYERFHQAIIKFLQRKNLLGTGSPLNQASIDNLLQSPAAADSPRKSTILTDHYSAMSKGLNEKTAQYIVRYLKEHVGEQHTCESLSQCLGLSKVTIRRYLNYFIEKGGVTSSIDYETGGRPSMRYTCSF